MRLLALTTTLLAPLCAQAFVDFTNDAFNGITVGQAFTLKWQGDGTPVTIELMNGPTNNLAKVSTVASTSDFPLSMFAGMSFDAHEASVIGAEYAWTPPSDLASGTYVLSISQAGYTNYSPQFSIGGGTSASPPPSSPNSPSPNPTPSATSTGPPPTGTWASFTALANQMQVPFPTGNLSNNTVPAFSLSNGVILPSVTSYRGNGSGTITFVAAADRTSVMRLGVMVAALVAGFVIVA